MGAYSSSTVLFITLEGFASPPGHTHLSRRVALDHPPEWCSGSGSSGARRTTCLVIRGTGAVGNQRHHLATAAFRGTL